MIYNYYCYYPFSFKKKEKKRKGIVHVRLNICLFMQTDSSNPKIYSCQEIAKSSLTQCKPGWPLSSTSRLVLICRFKQYSGTSLQPLAMVEWQQKWPSGAGYVSHLSPQSGHSLTSKPNRKVFHIFRAFVMVLWW